MPKRKHGKVDHNAATTATADVHTDTSESLDSISIVPSVPSSTSSSSASSRTVKTKTTMKRRHSSLTHQPSTTTTTTTTIATTISSKSSKQKLPSLLLLPPKLVTLLDTFNAIQTAITFLQKRHIQSTVQRIMDTCRIPSITLFQQILTIDSSLFILRPILQTTISSTFYSGTTLPDEVSSPTSPTSSLPSILGMIEMDLDPPGGGVAKYNVRKTQFHQSLLRWIDQFHTQYLHDHSITNYTIYSTETWYPDFQNNVLLKNLLPEVPLGEIPGYTVLVDPTRNSNNNNVNNNVLNVENFASYRSTLPEPISPVKNVLNTMITTTATTAAAQTISNRIGIDLTGSPGSLRPTISAVATLSERHGFVVGSYGKKKTIQERSDELEEEIYHSSSSSRSAVDVHPITTLLPATNTAATHTDPPLPKLETATFGNIEDYLHQLPQYTDQLIFTKIIPPRLPQFTEETFMQSLPLIIRQALFAKGIRKLFTHQAKAIQAALTGKHVVTSTSTSSGKSITFHIPVWIKLLENSQENIAIYIFPTKALAQDQLRSLREFISKSNSTHLQDRIRPATLDGDTPWEERDIIRDTANIIMCNPDILHATLLSNHKVWRRIIGGLKYVILDEAHAYRGIFGSHVALVLRRLVRLCNVYGTFPQFICCSATIANPLEHFRSLVPNVSTGSSEDENNNNVVIIHPDEDGSGAGSRKFILWNPPFISSSSSKSTVVNKPYDNNGTTIDNGTSNAHPTDIHQISFINASEQVTNALSLIDEDTRLRNNQADLQEMKKTVRKTKAKSFISPPTNSMNDKNRKMDPANSNALTTDSVGSTLVKPEVWNNDQESSSSTVPTVVPPTSSDPEKEYRRRALASRFLVPTNTELLRRRKQVELMYSSASLDLSSTMVPRWVQRWKLRLDQTIPVRRSAIVETAILLAALVVGGLRTLVFCRVRKVAELLLQYTHERLAAADHEQQQEQKLTTFSSSSSSLSSTNSTRPRPLSLIGKVKSYRAGYLKEHRRYIEQELFNGNLLAVVATNALELGIDIGNLDAVVILGHPGSNSALMQQAGRAGRGGRNGIAILVLYDSPIDQYLARNPESAFHRPPESVHIDVTNPNILRMHTMCAAYELPVCPWDLRLFTPLLGPIVQRLRSDNILLQDDEGSIGIAIDKQYFPAPKKKSETTAASGKSSSTIVTTATTSVPYREGHGFNERIIGGEHANQYFYAGDMDFDKEIIQEEGAQQDAGVQRFKETFEEIINLGLNIPNTLNYSHSINDFASNGTTTSSVSSSTNDASSIIPSVHAFSLAPWVPKPHSNVSLRRIDNTIYRIIDIGNGNRVVDEIDESRVFWECHEGAIHLHQGITYKCLYMDTVKKVCFVRVTGEQYYTNLIDHEDVNPVSRSLSCLEGTVHFGRTQVLFSAWGYRKIWKRTGEVFETCALSIPPLEFYTFSVWCDIPLFIKEVLDSSGLCYLGGCHGAGHAIMNILPSFIMGCDRSIIGTECPSPYQVRSRPLRVILYDNVPGGVGIAAAAFSIFPQLLQAALDLVESCECEDGCPQCIWDTSCSEFNVVLDKRATIIILRTALVDRKILKQYEQEIMSITKK